MGISILIVDDDKLLVEKLEETVNWSGIGIDMVFTGLFFRGFAVAESGFLCYNDRNERRRERRSLCIRTIIM